MSNLENELETAKSADVEQGFTAVSVRPEAHLLGISELQIGYSRGGLQVADVINHYVARIEARNATVKAFVDIDYDVIAAAVRESADRFENDTQRPLEGIPVAVTADFAVSGLSHHAGMIAREDVSTIIDCTVVQKLREAGAIIMGILNMDEAGFGSDCNNPFCGQTLNPHDLGHIAGGSAGGAAAAVAGGLCVAALGMDGAGNVRVPASFGGVFGYLPTPHQISTQSIWPCVTRFDSVGIVGRSVDDVAFLSNVLFTPDLATAMRRSRFVQLGGSGGVSCATDVSLAYASTVDSLRERPSDIVLSHSCADISRSAAALRGRIVIAQLVEMGEERCARLSQQFADRVDWILELSEEEFDASEAMIEQSVSELRQQIASNGILIVPTVPQTALKVGEVDPGNLADFVTLANIAGLPSVTLPVGRDQKGLPIGISLIGPVGGDAMVFAQARMLSDSIRGYTPPADE